MQEPVGAGDDLVRRRSVRAVEPCRRRDRGVEIGRGAQRIEHAADHQSVGLYRARSAFGFALASIEERIEPRAQSVFAGFRP